MNLTFSILLKPTFLSLRKQFYLTMVTSLAVTDLLQEQSVAGVKIKWPNDILVGKRKICGILIENSVQRDAIQQSIVGIGLNVNQQNFSTPKATSLSIVANKNFDLNKALNALLEKFEKRYLQVRGGKLSELKSEYLDNLFGLGESRTFTSGEKEFTGTVNDVNENGELVVDIHGGRRSYNLKEISFVI
jgi:BirA family biotin operon repressor/biotin-[acetyl-CoA-carboxylase] ligase